MLSVKNFIQIMQAHKFPKGPLDSPFSTVARQLLLCTATVSIAKFTFPGNTGCMVTQMTKLQWSNVNGFKSRRTKNGNGKWQTDKWKILCLCLCLSVERFTWVQRYKEKYFSLGVHIDMWLMESLTRLLQESLPLNLCPVFNTRNCTVTRYS